MRFFYLFALLFLIIQIHAQSLANYSSTRNTSVTYTSINLTGSSFGSWRNTTTNTQDDNRSDFTNIGFDFWYDGVRYTQFSVSTNGFLDFSTSTDDGGPQPDDFGYTNAAFSTANAANATRPAIAPFYDDLTAQGGTAALGNSVKYLMSGAAPNRTLTIEWINMAVFGNVTPSLNFQVRLVESTGVIFVNYGTMTAGTNNFSYSMGLNSPTVSAAPTAAQLKMLQTANGTTFNNTAQNALVTMPTTSSQYIFTPLVPTASSGNLTFSGVAQTSMTLNWTNWASNEVGYVIYNSTDGVNFDFVVQTALNATNTSITGLLPSTNYFWRLFAVTEGCLSSAITGTQATTAAGSKVSNASGNWNTGTIWTPNGVPTAADNVTISNGHSVTINTNGVCNNLIVGGGTASTLNFSGTARTLAVNNNITINNSAVFSSALNSNVTHVITVEGNITNNGTLNFAPDADSFVNVTFARDGNQTISGTGATTTFNRITMNMGTSVDNVLEITSSNFAAASNFLDLTSGTFKVSSVNAVNITPFTAATTLSANASLWLNSSNLTVNTSAAITLYGSIAVSNGTLNVGNASNEDLISNGGSINISGGVFNIAGKLDASGLNNTCDFNISGGMLVVPTFSSTSTTVAPFHISSAGSQCNMTGGSIVIQREGGTGAQNLGFTNTGSSGAIVSGGTLQIGNASTPASQIMDINTDSQVQNLVVNSANATARLNTNSLTVSSHVSIVAGVLNANNLDISVGGNWSDAGTFTPGTGVVTFNSNSAQSILKSGGEIFNSLQFTGTGVKTFSAPISASSNFSINSGSSVDVSASNFSLAVRGNFINSGTFNARSGLVMLNGTLAQTIGGSSTTDFFNLSLNNASGASLSSPENLKGTLTLSGGVFNANGQVFTMISDATNTARIAQITGTGDYSGNVTIQRFAPGGTTGWALLGSPLSSALTMNDWDDDIYIACPTCPDGNVPGFLSVYSYNETATGVYDSPTSYVGINTINDPITGGRGYWVYLGTGPVTTSGITLDLTGTPRKSTFSIPLNYTNLGSAANDGWNLITNPYPSSISWAALRGVTPNIDNAIYVYNADLNSGSGGFASYVNGISSPNIASGGIGDIIPMGQGFYVHSTGATALSAQESNKSASNPALLKSSASAAASQALMRLLLHGANAYEDETVLYCEPGANSFFDEPFDSYKMRGQDPLAASIALENGTDAFQINGISPVAGTFTTPLRTLTGVSGTYTITADNISSFPAGACISLYDKYTSVTTDLKTNDYIFNLEDTTTVSRFVLSITLNTLNVNATVDQPVCELPSSGRIIASPSNSGPWNYYWTSNGTAIKTSLNKTSADTLNALSGGNFDLAVNTVGQCDNNEAFFTVNQQIQGVASFSSIDTLILSLASSIQFSNTSQNAASSFWDFGTGQDYSNLHSPSFSYNAPGIYDVNLIVTSSTGCQDTAFKTVSVLSDIVGIDPLRVPTKEFLIRNFDNNLFELKVVFDEEVSIDSKLSDVSGKLISDYGTQSSKNFSLEVNLSGYTPGVYFLTLVSTSGKKVVKLPVH